MSVTEPLREEHRALLPKVEALRKAADMVGDSPLEAVDHEAVASYDFLRHHLIPHAKAEEAALYPLVARVLGSPRATATMSRDHVEVMRLTTELRGLLDALERDGLDARTSKGLRRVLYGLHAVVRVHFAKEEEIYLPLLDERVTAEEAAAMFAAMERAAAAARSVVG